MEEPGLRPSHPDHFSQKKPKLGSQDFSKGSMSVLDEEHLCALAFDPHLQASA